MKLLACDIGNSKIKSGVFEDKQLSSVNYFNSAEEFIQHVEKLNFNDIALSSVVPLSTQKIQSALSSNVKIFIIDRNCVYNLKLNYDSIETLGVDRICSCEGAFYLFRNSTEFKNYNDGTFLLTIDFGTATTINFIKYPGEFIGGIISPGIKLMSASLNSNTAQLPLVEISDYKTLIGRTTRQSIASGILNSTLSLIDEACIYLRKELNASRIFVFVTGGNAELIKPHLQFDFISEKGLVLYGIKAVYDRNKKNS